MAEVTGHLQNEQCAGDGGTDAGGKEGHHAYDDDIGRKDFINKIQGNQYVCLYRTQEGTGYEEGQEEAARYTASVTDEGKDILCSQKDKKEPQTVVVSSQLVHQLIASAQDLGKDESQGAGYQKGEENFIILVLKIFRL